MKSLVYLLLLLSMLLMFGCAAGSRQIGFASLQKYNGNPLDSLSIRYNPNPLSESRNMKYASYAEKQHLIVIAVWLTNQSSTPLTLEYSNFLVSTETGPEQLVDVMPAVKSLKQPGPIYMLWSILWLNIISGDPEDQKTIPIPIGAAIGLLNWFKSGSANENIHNTIGDNPLIGQTVAPGETVTGYIAYYGQNRNGITFIVNR